MCSTMMATLDIYGKGGLQPGPFREGPASKVRQGLQHGVVEDHSGLLGVAWRAGTEGKGHFGKSETESKEGKSPFANPGGLRA